MTVSLLQHIKVFKFRWLEIPPSHLKLLHVAEFKKYYNSIPQNKYAQMKNFAKELGVA